MSDEPSSADGGRLRRAGIIAVVAGTLAVTVAIALVVILVRRNGPDGTAAAGSTAPAADPAARLTGENRAQAFVAGATSDIAAVTTYSYRTLASDLSNAEAVTTGAYRARYRSAVTGSLGATARRLHRTQTFDLAAAGIGRISDDGRQAHVLIFGTQNVQDDTTHGRTNQRLVTLDATVRRSGESYLISGLEVDGNAGLPPGTTGLAAAAEAAREEVAAVLTTRRAHIGADDRAALARAVDPLRSQLSAQAAAVRHAVTKGGYDLSGEVTAIAVLSAAGDTATLLVAATGTRTTTSGSTSVTTDGRYQVVVVRVQGRWYVSAIDPVRIS